jgi:3',5'-cyclic-AMP phosphodiesterase
MNELRFGAHAPARRTLLHLSDTHLLEGARLGGRYDTVANLERTLERIRAMQPHPDAIILTGDLTERGEPASYRRLRALLEPLAQEIGATLIWVAGNHDERPALREHLLDRPATQEPVTSVHDLDGLRVIALDSTVPGWHHGELDVTQLEWLREELKTPAPLGTILAMHHPPLPSHIPFFDILELRDQPSLAAAIEGGDVRAILAGHLHYSTSGTFHGVPVSVASATCYTMDLALPDDRVNGMDAGQSFHLVHVWDDTITHAVVPVASAEPADTFTPEWYAKLAAMSEQERLDYFSRKR